MSVFVPPAVTTDPAILRQAAIAVMESEIPGWRPIAGSPEMVLIDAFSYAAGEQADVLSEGLLAAYRGLGTLINTPPIEAIPAAAIATITAVDAAGYSIPAGSIIVGLRNANGELEGFRLGAEASIPAGETSTTATVTAEEPGAGANSLAGVAELIAAPPSVLSVTLGTSGGGVEAETDAEYLTRLTEALALQKSGPVLAADAAAIALTVPGVYRATAVDNLKPGSLDGGTGTEETGVERAVTVACTDINGAPCSATVMAALDSLLQSLREQNFLYSVVRPHYTKVDVTATVFAWPGVEAASLKVAVEAKLAEALAPKRWASDRSGNPRRWVNDPVIPAAELYAALGLVPGVRWASQLIFGVHGGAPSSSDLVLGAGSAIPALPEPATIVVNVETS